METSIYNDISIAKVICPSIGTKIIVFLYNVDGLLIDTGPACKEEELEKWFTAQHITQVALTHSHEDHTGNAPWIQQQLKIPIYLQSGAIPSCHEEGVYPNYRKETFGGRKSFHPKPLPEIIKTDNYIFEVLDTPGHTIYHNCFYEKSQGWLFTGDLFISARPFICFYEENCRQLIDTIERLLKLDFDTVFCAHAGVVENGKAMLEKKYNYLKKLQERVIKMREVGKTDKEIDAEINKGGFRFTSDTCGEWSTYNIIRTL
ncbi:MBL fold metallo-hydrolase [Lachnospiraceae bacterium ZAX-1]